MWATPPSGVWSRSAHQCNGGVRHGAITALTTTAQLMWQSRLGGRAQRTWLPARPPQTVLEPTWGAPPSAMACTCRIPPNKRAVSQRVDSQNGHHQCRTPTVTKKRGPGHAHNKGSAQKPTPKAATTPAASPPSGCIAQAPAPAHPRESRAPSTDGGPPVSRPQAQRQFTNRRVGSSVTQAYTHKSKHVTPHSASRLLLSPPFPTQIPAPHPYPSGPTDPPTPPPPPPHQPPPHFLPPATPSLPAPRATTHLANTELELKRQYSGGSPHIGQYSTVSG